MTFTVAIIGRPNVGKSTLFNRIAGKRLALVDDMPGLTRDRRDVETEINNFPVRLVDTAGLEEAEQGSIAARMREQTQSAIETADLILFIIDIRAGITPLDQSFAQLVRSSGRPVLLLANKAESRAAKEGVFEVYQLGLGDPLMVSAEHGEGIYELYEAIEEHHTRFLQQELEAEAGKSAENGDDNEQGLEDGETGEDKPLRVAIVGRPNAGKSTLVNALLGEERMITGPEAGLTRDSIAADFTWAGQKLRLFDTAGLRRKARISQRAEKLSVGDALRAIQFAEVVILVVDADRTIEKQDLNIADLVIQEGRALIIAVNKWDMIEEKQAVLKSIHQQIETVLPQVKGLYVTPISALSGRGLDKMMKAMFQTYETWNKRLSTGALNRFLIDAVERHTPPAVGGRRIRLRYMTQPNARPPTFVVFCSRPEALPTSYTRYLINGLREAFALNAVPIRLHLRQGKNPYADKSS